MPRLPTRSAPLALLSLALLGTVPSSVAHAADPPKKVPGPGDPLPPLSLDYADGSVEYTRAADGTTHVVATGGVILVFGDLRIRADRIEFTQDGMLIRATGAVIIKRGDESLRGDSFSFSGVDGKLELLNSIAVSPPFYLSGDKVTRDPHAGLVASRARFVPSSDGEGEISVTAREIQVTADGGTLIFRHMTLFLAKRRLLSLRHLSLKLGSGGTGPTYQIPATVRYSGVSGVVVGAHFDLALPYKITGTYGVDLPTQGPIQYDLMLRRDLIPPVEIGRPRPGSVLYAAPGGAGAERYEGLSPLRQLLTARPKPPLPDPILDYESILATPDPGSRPLQSASRYLYLAANVIGNRDVGFKRQGPLVLSRLPEVSANFGAPLVNHLPQEADNDTLRRFLRSPRLQVFGSASDGYYREHRLSQDHATVSGDRQALTLGISTLPLLLTDHLLFRPQFSTNVFHYNTPASGEYRYTEGSATLDYVFQERTAVGVTYIRRPQGGFTPYTFDAVDTRNEGQIRGQVSLPGGHWIVGTAGRFDMDQGHLFDAELAAAWRGKTIEPRFSFRTLNKEFLIDIRLPSLVQ